MPCGNRLINEETHDRLLGRIVAIERREYVKRMFHWIISSRRPFGHYKSMNFEEELHLPSMILSGIPRKRLRSNDLYRLVRSCGNLVVIDEDTEEVQVAHYTGGKKRTIRCTHLSTVQWAGKHKT